MPIWGELGFGNKDIVQHLDSQRELTLKRANVLLRREAGYQQVSRVLSNKAIVRGLKEIWNSWSTEEKGGGAFKPVIDLPVVDITDIREVEIEDEHKRSVWWYIWERSYWPWDKWEWSRDIPQYTDEELQGALVKSLERGGNIDILGRSVYGYTEVENLGYRVGGGLPTRMEFRHHERKIGEVSTGVQVNYKEGKISIYFQGHEFSDAESIVDFIGDRIKGGKTRDLYDVPNPGFDPDQFRMRERREEEERERRRGQSEQNDGGIWDDD